MSADQFFRWLFIAIFLGVFSISGYFRSRARRSGETIPRTREGKLRLLSRIVIAAPLYLSFLAYMVNPDWMAWSSVPLPSWLRVLGVVVGFGMLPVLYWVVRSIGSNISETFLTKEKHVLVTHGPYRWIRHPLYTVSTVAFIALALLAANWFMMVMAVLAIMGVLLAVIPREEAQLILKFGDQYREYRTRTGKLLPRILHRPTLN